MATLRGRGHHSGSSLLVVEWVIAEGSHTPDRKRSIDRFNGGAALDEAVHSGIENPLFNLNVRRAIRTKGLAFVSDRIESPLIPTGSLFNASTIMANMAGDASKALLMLGRDFTE